MGDGRVEGWSARRIGGQAAVSRLPDVGGSGSGSLSGCIFESSQLKGSHVGDFCSLLLLSSRSLYFCLMVSVVGSIKVPTKHSHALAPGPCGHATLHGKGG